MADNSAKSKNAAAKPPAGKVRVRFAPSPTGLMHIGGVRTALFNWLLAKNSGGEFILRLEDTDRARYHADAEQSIMDSLRWLGLDWDEGPDIGGPYGPYQQSERKALYGEYADKLLASGAGYICTCSSERLAELREQQKAAKQPPGYDGHCFSRGLTKSEVGSAEYVIRMHVPGGQSVTFNDIIHGEITFNTSTISDFVIVKSDGMPTYHFAHLVDDYEMRISHVIRGEEWISSAPKHVLILDALGLPRPAYVHVPLLIGADRAKLSKRHGDVSFDKYTSAGYLPDAVLNYLVNLGWSTGDDTEIMARSEIIGRFDLAHIQKHPAVFDQDKLRWVNSQHWRGLSAAECAELLTPFLERPHADGGLSDEVARPLQPGYLAKLLPVMQERIDLLGEAAAALGFFFTNEVEYERELLLKKGADAAETAANLAAVVKTLESLEDFEHDAIEKALYGLAEELGVKAGVLFYPIRISVTGSKVAPPLFDVIYLIGRAKVVKRINNAIAALGGAD